ncbi:MAG: transposase [Snowella sp.]|nr:transposase [Snowella sp.]
MRVCGLDICKGWAVAWLLDDIPDNIKDDYQRDKVKRSRDPEQDDFTFYFCHDQYEKVLKPGTKTVKIASDKKIKRGIETFLSWKPELVVLEPTGLHYSLFISKVCEYHGIQVRWISHDVCKSVRTTHKLHDKTDLADAYILAIQGVIYGHKPSYWIRFEDMVLRLRELYHFKKFLTRLSVRSNNRSQQHLALEFPESVALFKDVFSLNDGCSALLAAVAGRQLGIKKSDWVKRLDNSIARQYGIHLSHSTQYLATLADDLHIKLIEVNSKLESTIYSSPFVRYNEVFDRFQFGLNLRAIILILIYPFSERFNQQGLSVSTRIAKFNRRLGMAKIEYQSGISVKGEKTGSSSGLCRSEFYMHVSSRYKLLSKRKGFVHATEEMQRVQTYHDEKEAKLKGNPELLHNIWVSKQKARLHAAHLAIGMSVKDSLAFIDSVDWSSKDPNHTEKQRLIGDLLINRTGAYICKQLFKALLDVGPDLDN